MAKQQGKRAGGKFTASHTTVTPGAEVVADWAAADPFVTKISLGVITAGLRPSRGQQSLKIAPSGHSLLCVVRSQTSVQELRLYTTDPYETVKRLRDRAEAAGYLVRLAGTLTA
jgi:hypothetical protein